LEALQVCLRVLDADDYIIQSDAVVHEVTIRPKNFRFWTQCGSLCCIAAKPSD
jgi:hypothetical protein